ncbi:MAG: galactose-1-phosphate uridylyltransferase [Candidatus Saganbacteria bacterium]|nr:galactose-1-phosphate uridylyltransferase [Candidatus Saganbacteria bacterium]
MSELRRNPLTKDWVIIATERAKRPEDFVTAKSEAPINEDLSKCPFCPGNEGKTPPELLAYRPTETKPNTPGWWIRVTNNQFPALAMDGVSTHREIVEGFNLKMPGFGEHEVIIETPDHHQTIATMDPKQVEEIFSAYRERYRDLAKDPRFEAITLFKNHGAGAGTSLRHPHSQIVATPVTPLQTRNLMEEAIHYFDASGSCLFCDMIKVEQSFQKRIVLETSNFIVFSPFAAALPFQTFVFPKKHNSNFEEISPEDCRELAGVMRIALTKLYKGLHNPDFNYVLVSAPCREKDMEHFHWHFKIFPRITKQAGFEIGSGMFINSVIPEEAARFLREIVV